MSDTGHRVLLFAGRGIISALIRFQSRGKFSHAAMLCPNGEVLESWQGTGVRQTKLDSEEGVHRFTIPSASPEQWGSAEKFIRAQLKMKYDYWGVIRFVSRRSMPENERWFCSELVFAALMQSGVRLLERIPASEVDPSRLSISPLMVPEVKA